MYIPPQIHDSVLVTGAWNNYEGLHPDFNGTFFDHLKHKYTVKIGGKTDWTSGSHSLDVRLNAWTKYVEFPYNVHKNGGWHDEDDVCKSNGTVLPGRQSGHKKDWKQLNENLEWIENFSKSNPGESFFVYQGMNIVHPPYVTNEYWFEQINESLITIPDWDNLEDLHPCEFQTIMLKNCAPSDVEKESFYSKERRRRIRRIYYAMIEEFDSMVGKYIAKMTNLGLMEDTIFIVTSDHGDMNMEHQQHYKMSPLDGSSRVPLIISWSGKIQKSLVQNPVQLIDLFPTLMEISEIAPSNWPELDGFSLFPFLGLASHSQEPVVSRPSYVASQFHGDNVAMSWYLLKEGNFKFITYETGKELRSELFDVVSDPGEKEDIAIAHPELVVEMEKKLQSVIDYPSVSEEVARYNRKMFLQWKNSTPFWKETISASNLRWYNSWSQDSEGAFAAIERWLANPTKIVPCKFEMTVPSIMEV